MRLYQFALVALTFLVTAAVAGDDFSIDWSTVDGGGEMFAALAGTGGSL